MKNIDLNKLNLSRIWELRIKDLPLSIEGSILEERLKRLFSELLGKELIYKPHIWISSEWFTPDDIPGFGIPFYLLHKKLIRLEKREMFEAEGEGTAECMRILRHETGHAVSHAYQLYSSREWNRIFGRYDSAYPKYYSPDPASKNYVVHLNAWYAQAHPVEDFAETFAVWLNPRSNWRKRYRGWPALEKLNYINRVMNSLKNREPLNKSTDKYEELGELNYKIRTYYKRKKKFYELEWPEPYDRRLTKIFHNDMVPREAAASFLRKIRKEIRTHVSEGLDVPPYTVDQLILNMMRRCRQLNLKRADDSHDSLKKILVILSAQLSNYIQSGYHKIPL